MVGVMISSAFQVGYIHYTIDELEKGTGNQSAASSIVDARSVLISNLFIMCIFIIPSINIHILPSLVIVI